MISPHHLEMLQASPFEGILDLIKKLTNDVHLMTFENLKTCGNLWEIIVTVLTLTGGRQNTTSHVHRTTIRGDQACALWSTREIYFRSAVLEVSRPSILNSLVPTPSVSLRDTSSEM